MLPSVTTVFTPVESFLGGVLIGLSALLVLFLFGRIAGISGITTAGILKPAGDWHWRFAFILGLALAPLVLTLAGLGEWGLERLSESTVSGYLPGMALAGLLVGLGTVIGSGCTSGHGVCGLGRLSLRSLVAVAVFMFAAAVTVFVLRHLL